MEILNEMKLPQEISWNILKFMSHPTAEIIKPVFKTYIIYDEDGVYFYNNLDNNNCERCHKFRINHKFSKNYCKACKKQQIISSFERDNKWRIKNGHPIKSIEYLNHLLSDYD
jgi:hypothetical protein